MAKLKRRKGHADKPTPTPRQAYFGMRLRALRDARGETSKYVSEQLEWTAGTLTRMERGDSVQINLDRLRALLVYYGIPDADREELVQVARDIRDQRRSWWHEHRAVLPDAYLGFESEATALRTYEALMVPGLLQTPEYTAALIHGSGVRDPIEINRRVEIRAQRQELLQALDGPSFWAVIDDAALRKPVGGAAVMRGQLKRLADVAELPNVGVQVLPDAAGAHAAMHGQFVIMEFPSPLPPTYVYVETAVDARFLDEPPAVERYSMIFQHACASALSVEASVAYLRALIDRLDE